MTKLLEQAIVKISALPESEQDEVARMVLGELEEDRAWASSSLRHADQLRRLADEAWAEHESGQSQELDPENL
jgi:hypothetical protein